eukprot:6290477-Amphidinium_carterae.1
MPPSIFQELRVAAMHCKQFRSFRSDVNAREALLTAVLASVDGMWSTGRKFLSASDSKQCFT